jgi:hypothetical protein
MKIPKSLFAVALILASGAVDAQNYPCSGMKGGVDHCLSDKFVCRDGSVSQSKRKCDAAGVARWGWRKPAK